MFGEHKKETDKISAKNYTRSQKKSVSDGDDLFKSAVAEHVAETNHVTGWDEAKIIDKEGNRKTREMKEAIWIRRKRKSVHNKDEGAYYLSNIYDQLISIPPSTSAVS